MERGIVFEDRDTVDALLLFLLLSIDPTSDDANNKDCPLLSPAFSISSSSKSILPSSSSSSDEDESAPSCSRNRSQQKERHPIGQGPQNLQPVQSVVIKPPHVKSPDCQSSSNIDLKETRKTQRYDSTETLVDDWKPSLQDLPAVPATPTAEIELLEDEISGAPSVNEQAAASVIDDTANKRVDRILDFLKQVEEDDIVKTAETHNTLGAGIIDITNRSSPASVPTFDSVKAKIMGQQMEIEEKARTLAALKKELKKFKDLNKEQLTE